MISRIEAFNHRCLRNISPALDRFHVLAGPNGSGKGTLLEVARFLGAFARDGIEAISEVGQARQIPELLFRGQGTKFQLAAGMPVPEAVLGGLHRKNSEQKRVVRYEVEIGADEANHLDEPRILAENLWFVGAGSEVSRQEMAQHELRFPSASLPHRDSIHGQRKTPAGWRKVASKTNVTEA